MLFLEKKQNINKMLEKSNHSRKKTHRKCYNNKKKMLFKQIWMLDVPFIKQKKC